MVELKHAGSRVFERFDGEGRRAGRRRGGGAWLAFTCLWGLAACGPMQPDGAPTGTRRVASLTQAAAVASVGGAGVPDPGCRALGDPARRSRMSAALERKLSVLCGEAPAVPATAPGAAQRLAQRSAGLAPRVRSAAAAAVPGTDIPVSDPALDSGGTTQSETTMVAVGDVVCAAWNDAGEGFGANGFSGHGVSLDGGATFTDGGPFPNGPFDSNFGDPTLAFSVRDQTFYYAALSSAGLSLWRSTNSCQTFEYVAPIHFGGEDDKELITVDNSPSSPFFGRIHIGWTNFGLFTDINVAAHSDDGGLNWTAPLSMPGSGSNGQGMYPAVAPNGDVFMAAVNGNGDVGGVQNQQIYKSSDGGNSWSRLTDIATEQLRPEDFSSSFNCGRQALTGNIRFLASPQIAVTADPSAAAGYVVHAVYAYDSDGPGPDHSNVFYKHSVDGAQSWSGEVQLNDDETATDQFFVALGAGDDGTLAASWYDRRLDPFSNLAFDRFMTFSTDGGATWNQNVRVSDVSSPVAQTLPNFDGLATCYHGDYDQVAATSGVVHVLWSDDRRITFTGPNPDVYYDQFAINTSLGHLRVAQSSVGCTGAIAVSLVDSDLAGAGTQAVLASSSRGDSETLVLTEIPGKPGNFSGSINTVPGAVVMGDSVLEVEDGDVITLTYNDADDGHGQPAVATVQVATDCAGPVLSNVRSSLVARDAATIAVDSSEPANLRVDYGAACDALTASKSSDGFALSPAVTIDGLAPGRTYLFAVTATDQAGNVTHDDNGGACYSFSTPDVVYKNDFESGLAGFTIDNTAGRGNGLWHLGQACAAAVLGHSAPHSLYYGQDETCTYNTGFFANAGVVTSPTITLGSSTFASLEFSYYLGNEGGGFFDQGGTQVSVNGGPFTTVDSTFARLEDEDPEIRTREDAEPAGRLALVANTARWQHATMDLSSLLSGGSEPSTLQIRFTFDTIDGALNNFAGFYVDDVLVVGVTPAQACTTDTECDDGLFCTGVETCKGGFCAKGLPVTCASTDAVDCTEDVCDEVTHGCVNKPNDARCDDGLLCDGAEICDPSTGCRTGQGGCGDDGIACTFESCNEPLKQCTRIPQDFLCNDGLFCTGFETCDPTFGCRSSGSPCNDGIDCTIDQCNEFSGCTTVPDNTQCDDGLFCTGAETCQAGVGCITTGNPCSGANTCDERFHQCVPTCFTTTNVNHQTAGRATHTGRNFFALGSNDALGIGAAVTSLQGSGGSWHRVASCPVPPTITALNASVVGDAVTISGSTADGNNDVTVVKLTISSATQPTITLNAPGGATFSATIALAPGDYTVVAQAFDASGLSSALSPPIPFSIVPFAPPHIDSISVSVNSINVVVSGTASDVNHDISFVQITILKNGAVFDSVVATGRETWSGAVSTLLPGLYSARAQAFDATNRVSGFSATVPFTVVDRCVADINANHQTAGRATFTTRNGYRALGSNDSLGKVATTITALQGAPGFWKRVTTCPVPAALMSISPAPVLVSLAP